MLNDFGPEQRAWIEIRDDRILSQSLEQASVSKRDVLSCFLEVQLPDVPLHLI